MEILLGDKAVSDLVGLGELLANQCAYLIAKSHDQRAKILTEFEKKYMSADPKCHQGKEHLSPHERELFYKLQWTCRRVIQKEVDLLKEDVGKEGAQD